MTCVLMSYGFAFQEHVRNFYENGGITCLQDRLHEYCDSTGCKYDGTIAISGNGEEYPYTDLNGERQYYKFSKDELRLCGDPKAQPILKEMTVSTFFKINNIINNYILN